jgi:hypothetical protein
VAAAEFQRSPAPENCVSNIYVNVGYPGIRRPGFILIILLVAVSFSCEDSLELKEPNWEKESDSVTTDDINILNAVLDDSFKSVKKKSCTYVVVLNRTERSCSYAVRPWEHMCIADNDLFTRAAELNSELKKALKIRTRRCGIIKGLSSTQAVKLVKPAEIETLQPNFWNAFYQRFPNSCGFVSFSLPGYSRDRLSAAVYFSAGCDGLCGVSSIIELSSTIDGQWAVKKHHILSMS